MRSNATRVLAGIVALAVVVALFVVLRDDGGESAGERADTNAAARAKPGDDDAPRPAASPVATVVVKQGEPVGGIAKLSFSAGERVRFRVRSDVADEVHVHGYDLTKDVEAGGSVSFDFPATIEGVFEVELEHRHAQIIELTVNP